MRMSRAGIVVSVFLLAMSALASSGCPGPEEATDRPGSNLSTSFGELLSSTDPSNFPGSISGTVFVDGHEQAFGTVQAFRMDGEFVSQERCTLTGHFWIKDLVPGRYRLAYLSASGNPLGQETVVEVRPGRTEQVDLELTTR